MRDSFFSTYYILMYMDELIDILDEQGNYTGKTALKSVAHKNGLYHQCVHVWFYTDTQKLLLQKRASVKKVFPNLWDVSVAGHVHSGETLIEAAIRETKEEIGLGIKSQQLTFIGNRKDVITHPNGILDCEFKYIYICKLTTDIKELTPQKDELDDIHLFDFSILKDTTKHGSFMVPNFKSYYDYIYQEIVKRVN